MSSVFTAVVAASQALAPAAAPNSNPATQPLDSSSVPTSLRTEFKPSPDNRRLFVGNTAVRFEGNATTQVALNTEPSSRPNTLELISTIDPVASEQKAIVKAVADAKAADPSLKVSVAPQIMDGSKDAFVAGADAITKKWYVSAVEKASEDINRWTLENLYVHRDLRPAATGTDRLGELRVAPFAVQSQSEGDKTRVTVVDYLRETPKTIFDGSFTTTSNVERDATRNEVANALVNEWLARKTERQQFLDSITPTPGRTSGYLVEPSTTPQSERTKAEFARLAAEGASVRIAVTPPGARVDRLFTESTIVALSGEALSGLNQQIKVNGPIEFVNFAIPILPRNDGQPGYETTSGRVVDAPVKAKTDGALLMSDTMVTDQFGNVFSYYIHRGTDSSPATLNISTYPARALSKDGESRSMPLSLDLSKLGLGKIEGIAQQRSLPRENPAAPPGSYALYVDLPDASQKVKVEPFYPAMINGTGSAEDLFGVPRGSVVSNIIVANSAGINASFNPQLPNNIRIQNKALTDHRTVAGVASHEAAHALDNKFNLSGGKFEERFNQIKGTGAAGAKFFEALNESKFRSDMTYGGHSEENRYEFVASFINSLTEPRFAETIARQTPEFRQTYRETLDALSYQVKMNPEISSEAPIHKLIAERRKMLGD